MKQDLDKQLKTECRDGTGRGSAERVYVVCAECGGSGCKVVTRIIDRNPGRILKAEDLKAGEGVAYEEGGHLPAGTEPRSLTCPLEWERCTGSWNEGWSGWTVVLTGVPSLQTQRALLGKTRQEKEGG